MPQRHRLSSGLAALDALLDGGIVRGRISEIIGPIGSGRTTIAACFVAVATRAGEVVAWLETTRSFAPAAIAASSASLERVLWVLVDDRQQLVLEPAGGGCHASCEIPPSDVI
jgi:recombination protein RecA